VCLETDGKFDSFEAALTGFDNFSIGVEVSGGEYSLCYIELNPTGSFELGIFVITQVSFFAGVGVFYYIPTVAG
jgi:hypothetical protein